jgi:hypothetical protein
LLLKEFGPAHVYEAAAVVVKFKLLPTQTGLLLAGNIAGAGLTTTVVVIVLVQPVALDPINV